MWWKSNSVYAANVPVDINHASGTASMTVDQTSSGGQWNLLGTYDFDAGTSGSITIDNAGTSGHVIADAVRFAAQD